MKDIVNADEIIKGEVNYSEIEGRYTLISVRAGLTGFDWKKKKCLTLRHAAGAERYLSFT